MRSSKFPPTKPTRPGSNSELKGFGVRKRGDDATYVLQYQLNGKTSKLTLGKCSEIRCDVARAMAETKRGEISKARLGLGIDPAIEREKSRQKPKNPNHKPLAPPIADYLEAKREKSARGTTSASPII